MGVAAGDVGLEVGFPIGLGTLAAVEIEPALDDAPDARVARREPALARRPGAIAAKLRREIDRFGGEAGARAGRDEMPDRAVPAQPEALGTDHRPALGEI